MFLDPASELGQHFDAIYRNTFTFWGKPREGCFPEGTDPQEELSSIQLRVLTDALSLIKEA